MCRVKGKEVLEARIRVHLGNRMKNRIRRGQMMAWMTMKEQEHGVDRRCIRISVIV